MRGTLIIVWGIETKMADDILEEGKAVDYFIELLNEEISNQIRRLLEERHLYQKVKVERIEELRTKALRRVAKESQEWLGSLLDKELNARCSLILA